MALVILQPHRKYLCTAGRQADELSGTSIACDTLVWNLDPSGDFLEAPQQPVAMVRDTSRLP